MFYGRRNLRTTERDWNWADANFCEPFRRSNQIKKAKAAKAANDFPISPPTFRLFRPNPSGF